MSEPIVYADNNATTRVADEARFRVAPIRARNRLVRRKLDEARAVARDERRELAAIELRERDDGIGASRERSEHGASAAVTPPWRRAPGCAA